MPPFPLRSWRFIIDATKPWRSGECRVLARSATRFESRRSAPFYFLMKCPQQCTRLGCSSFIRVYVIIFVYRRSLTPFPRDCTYYQETTFSTSLPYPLLSLFRTFTRFLHRASRSPHAYGFFSDLPFSPFTFPIFFLILLAAPCFLNLSIGHPPSLLPWYILRERDPTLSSLSLFLLTNPPRIFVSASELVLLSFSLSFSLSLLSFQPLSPGPFSSLSLYLSLYPSFSLFLLASVPFSSSRSCAGLFGLSPSHLLSLLRYDPSGRAAPLAARKKGGPKRTSYFLCSDSDLGGPKWPPMM